MQYLKKLEIQAVWSKDGATYHKEWGQQIHKGGHWVIIGPDSDVYGCAAEVFEQTYEPVEAKPGFYRKVAIVEAYQISEDMTIGTLEGPSVGKVGDWLITNATGEQYFASDSYFREHYALV